MPVSSVEEVRQLVAAVVAEVAPREGPIDAVEDSTGEESLPPRTRKQLADIAVGAEHGGFYLKQLIPADLREHGFSVHDCGTESEDSGRGPGGTTRQEAVQSGGEGRHDAVGIPEPAGRR